MQNASQICNKFIHGRSKANSDKAYRCTAPSTGGSNYNIGQIKEGEFQFGVAQSDWQYHAYNGSSKWEGKQYSNLRAVFSVHNEPFQIWARKKAKVKDFAGLEGKVVNIGNPGSGQRGTMEELMKAKGVSNSFFKSVTELTSSEQHYAMVKLMPLVILLVFQTEQWNKLQHVELKHCQSI